MSTLPDYPPVFTFSALPEEERELAVKLHRALCQLRSHVEEFGHALSLFDYADSEDDKIRQQISAVASLEQVRLRMHHLSDRNRLAAWKRMAAKDAAMTVYNLNFTREEINGYRTSCPRLFHYVPRVRQKKSNQIFEYNFRDFARIRTAAAHGEFARSAEQHALRGSDRQLGVEIQGPVFISDMLAGRTLAATFNGKLVKSELSKRKHEALIEITKELYLAFHEADLAMRKAAQEPQPRPPPGSDAT